MREFHRDKIKDSTFIYCFHQELPQRMLARLHLFRRFSLELWGHILPHSIVPRVPEVFIEYVRRKWRPKTSGTAVKTFLTSWSSCTVSISTFLKLPIIGLALFVVYLFFVFVQIFNACFLYIIGLVAISPFLVICPFASSGLWQLMDVNFLHRYILFPVRLVVVLLDMLVSCLATFGVVFVLQYAAVGVAIFLQLAIPLVFSEHNLPQVACCVLVACYLWKSYRSFIQKYRDLAAALFERQQQLKYNGRETGLNMQNFTPDDGRTIPKVLFDKACEELMPIRKCVCTLLLEATLSVFLVFLGFSLATILSLPPATQALLIFAVGSIMPEIITMKEIEGEALRLSDLMKEFLKL